MASGLKTGKVGEVCWGGSFGEESGLLGGEKSTDTEGELELILSLRRRKVFLPQTSPISMSVFIFSLYINILS